MVAGKPTKNPRYLQLRPDVARPQETASAELAIRLYRKQTCGEALATPVDIVAAGRRNNAPEDGGRALCAFNPLHYMELPELFMEFISSMTGKSPSTTGTGSEGALTKGPFNAMPAIIDLNAAVVSFALTGYDGWVSCAGYVGPNVRVDHDVSLLIPEVFARMSYAERSAENLIAQGALERVTDFEHKGKIVRASSSRLSNDFSICRDLLRADFPAFTFRFTDEILRPEFQDLEVFVESVGNIAVTHERIARSYFDDGTIALACPPLKCLLDIMAYGKTTEGNGLDAPAVRGMFSRESVLSSKWYAARLDAKRRIDSDRLNRAVAGLSDFIEVPDNDRVVKRLGLLSRLEQAKNSLENIASMQYCDGLVGTLGVQDLLR